MRKRLRAAQQEEAESTLRELKANTPSLPGKPRKAWKMSRFRGSGGRYGFGWDIHNDTEVIKYLEDGTGTRRPTTAQNLYIPLRNRARSGYKPGFKYGKDFILSKSAKGIKAHNIVKDQLPKTRNNMKNRWRRIVRAANKV